MSEQPPPAQSASDQSAERVARPIRRTRVALPALILGVLAIPLALTVYLGAACGLLGLVLGLIGFLRTRQGRATGRGMAITGALAGLVGMVIAISLGIYGVRTYRDCEAKLGHKPTQDELRDCVRSGI